ncbi:MAG: Ig-like domain-containing protein, partial [Planctomycetaceae bacterium]
MSRRRLSRTNQLAELLETREVLSALTLMPDFVQDTLPATATSFPSLTVNVLANDTGAGMQITELQSLGFGTTELLPVGNGVEAGTVRFTPGPEFRGRGSFQYVVTDASGQTSAAAVFVHFDKEP